MALSFVEPQQRSRLAKIEAFLKQQEREANAADDGDDDSSDNEGGDKQEGGVQAGEEEAHPDPIIRPYYLKVRARGSVPVPVSVPVCASI